MKMLHKTYLLIFISIFILVTSCSDFLEEENMSNYTQEEFFQTPDQAETAINNLYAGLRFISDGSGTYGESPFMMLEFPTGIAKTDVGQAEYNLDLLNLNANSENNYFENWWEKSYEGIANANLSIKRIPEIEDMDESVKEGYIGQAKFIRAFHYFNLVRIFGDLPLILEPVDANSDLLYPERSPEADIYDIIVEDLTEAEKTDLPFRDEDGRVSKGAVKSLLANVYLTMAGYPLQGGDDYYQKAADKAKEVIDNGSFQLFGSYDDLHDPKKRNSGEFIFQNNYSSGENITNGLTQWFLPRSKKISQFSDEYGAVRPVQEFLDTYDSGDKRIKEGEFYFTEYPSLKDPDDIIEFSPHIYKFFDEDAVLRTAESDLNWTFIRYADVLLIYAEAGLKAYGPTNGVLEAINEIRRRAELPEFNGNITKEDIWKERLHELAYESKYWFDMVRRRKVLNLKTGIWEDFVGHEFINGETLTEKYLLFGIPQTEIDTNNNLEQNPGY